MKLREIAHSRTGDKGNMSNISIIVYKPEDYHLIEKYVTADKVKDFFAEVVKGNVIRYDLPNIGALNFVLQNSLGGGVTRTLSLDAHGKSLCSALMDFEIPAK